MTITVKSCVNKDEIDRMVHDAGVYAPTTPPPRRGRDSQECRLAGRTRPKDVAGPGQFVRGAEKKERVEADLKSLKEGDKRHRHRGHQSRRLSAWWNRRPGAWQETLSRPPPLQRASGGDGPDPSAYSGPPRAGAENDEEVVDAEIVDEGGQSA